MSPPRTSTAETVGLDDAAGLRSRATCSDTEHAECIDQIEDDQRQSELEGCDTEFDDFIECADAELECVGDDVDLDGCSTLQEALASCYGG